MCWLPLLGSLPYAKSVWQTELGLSLRSCNPMLALEQQPCRAHSALDAAEFTRERFKSAVVRTGRVALTQCAGAFPARPIWVLFGQRTIELNRRDSYVGQWER